ncbi:hypothetical protein Tco_0727030 [Tanacetum coccineum]|uniref:Uncharacterized protein n=1 Tax=Tanacetum coccineum TaxID=301880 RepID=A0ABQ4YH85_9ASTR
MTSETRKRCRSYMALESIAETLGESSVVGDNAANTESLTSIMLRLHKTPMRCDDDNFLCSMRSLLRPVSWLGSHTEHVIAFMSSLCVGHQRVEKAIKENTSNALLLSDSGKASNVHRIASASAKRPTHPNVDPEVFQMRHQHCARNGEKYIRASRRFSIPPSNSYKRKFQAQIPQVPLRKLEAVWDVEGKIKAPAQWLLFLRL